jgi:hypothetical protein
MNFLILSVKNILLDFESVAKVASILWKARKKGFKKSKSNYLS